VVVCRPKSPLGVVVLAELVPYRFCAVGTTIGVGNKLPFFDILFSCLLFVGDD